MPPKSTKKVKQPIPLEDIDTSVLSLQQLREFCVRVDSEIRKVETESKELEIERNKLKISSDIANQQLMDEKSRLRWTENQLDKEKEQFVLKLLEMNNRVRNIRIELVNECTENMEESFTKLQSMTKSSVERCDELLNDIRELKCCLGNNEIEKLNRITKLEIDHDENRSKLLQRDFELESVKTIHRKSQRREIITRVLDRSGKELDELTKYKDKLIKSLMTKNDKDTLYTRQYYEKILDTNRTVLENLHEKYKTVKGNLTSYSKQIAKLKAHVTKNETEINENKEHRKIMHFQMMDSEQVKEKQISIKSECKGRNEELMERKADKMVLDEILAICEKDTEQKRKQKEDVISSLQLKVIKAMTSLEQLAAGLCAQVNVLDQLIEFAEAKLPYAGHRMSCQQTSLVALQSLMEEAERELKEQRKISMIDHVIRE